MAYIPWNKGITKSKASKCLCGCGEFVRVHKYSKKNRSGFSYVVNKFIKGHEKRRVSGFNPDLHLPRPCACGCGMVTKKFHGKFNLFIKGHENIGRMPWNKDKKFSEISRAKMRLARLGKEPANKIPIDLQQLHKLYVEDKKNISLVSKELTIPPDAIKNRLKSLGWNRSTKESCSTDAFRDRMRVLRIKFLTSKKVVEAPNKLEQHVYNAIDRFDIPYQKQTSLFNKFVVDAFFPQRNLVLEIYGRYWHEMPKVKKKDFSKKKYLEKCGYVIEELWDYEIKKQNIDLLLSKIFQKHNLL